MKAPNSFSYFQHIAKPSAGKRWVIPDIHGCLKTFQKVLDNISLSKKDQLFLLGDYINRGPSSSKVLDLILNLLDQGYCVYPLRGNHEQIVIESQAKSATDRITFLEVRKSMDLLDDQGVLISQYLDFMEHLPYYYITDDYYFVHGGFNFSKTSPLEDYGSMLWLREFEPDLTFLEGKKMITGHMPTPLEDIKEAIATGQHLIRLDNGCVHKYLYEDQGNLLCLNLDTLELLVQPNIDF